MSFALIIFIRVLFVACMVFILGYIFGSFGKRPVLKTISRIAAILVIVLFIAMNILFVRAAIGGCGPHGPWQDGGAHHRYGQQECPFNDHEHETKKERKSDSTGMDQVRDRTGLHPASSSVRDLENESGRGSFGQKDAREETVLNGPYLTSVLVNQTSEK